MAPKQIEQHYTLDDVENIVKRKVRTLRGDIARGALKVVKIGRSIRVPASSLAVYLQGGK